MSKMNDSKMEKQKERLVQAGLMEADDTLVDYVQTNNYHKLIAFIGEWKKGWSYFTEKRFIYSGGLLGENAVIPYTNIRSLGKCTQMLLPIGITITYEDTETGKTITSKFSMMKRDKRLDFLAEKTGISIS